LLFSELRGSGEVRGSGPAAVAGVGSRARSRSGDERYVRGAERGRACVFFFPAVHRAARSDGCWDLWKKAEFARRAELRRASIQANRRAGAQFWFVGVSAWRLSRYLSCAQEHNFGVQTALELIKELEKMSPMMEAAKHNAKLIKERLSAPGRGVPRCACMRDRFSRCVCYLR